MNSKRRAEGSIRAGIGDGQLSQRSQHSEGRLEVDSEGVDRFFSFNQSYNNIQQNDKMILEKTNSLSKIRNLEEQLKSCKSKAGLWDKAKSQITNLNKYLKLSSISLGCSDSAIMKEFFEAVNQQLISKDGKTKDEKSKIVESKKKEAELFEKLVQSNKKKYELQQKIVQYQHQISKLTEINDSLREKSRVQSTQRSSKIRQFHQQTLMSLQQKDDQVSILEQRNNELKLEMVRYEQALQSLTNQLELKERDLVETKDSNEELFLECQNLKRMIEQFKEDQKQTQKIVLSIKQELQKILQENATIRGELKQKQEEVSLLRKLIDQARVINEQYMSKTQLFSKQAEESNKKKIEELLKKEEQLKKNFSPNKFFAISRQKSIKNLIKSKSQKSELLLPLSQELLI